MGSRRLRVVFVDHVARLSGGEIALLRLLPALSEQVDVRVVLGEDGPLVVRLIELGIDVEVLPLPPRVRDVRREEVRPDRLQPALLPLLLPYVQRLRRRLRALGPDLVHTNSLKAALYAGLAARLERIPVVWHVRDRIAADYLPRSAVGLVRAASRMLPAAIVANSQATLKTLPAGRLGEVVHNAVVPDAVAQLPQRLSRASGQTTVGVVGRLAPWKGQHVFLDAFAEAFRGTSVRGRVIGSAMFGEEVYDRALRQQSERLEISGQIEFCGFQEDIWAELSELDILVHCSVSPEPFGQVVLEGMAAGLPVIAAAGGGPDELITNGVDGVLTARGDVGELAAALRRLHEDPELRAKLGSAARERSQEFTPERAAEQLVAVYRTLIVPSASPTLS